MTERFGRKLHKMTEGNLSAPIVAMGWNSERLDGRNLALRMVALGSATRRSTGTAAVARLGRLRGCPKPTWLSRIGNAQATGYDYKMMVGVPIDASASLSTDRPMSAQGQTLQAAFGDAAG